MSLDTFELFFVKCVFCNHPMRRFGTSTWDINDETEYSYLELSERFDVHAVVCNKCRSIYEVAPESYTNKIRWIVFKERGPWIIFGAFYAGGLLFVLSLPLKIIYDCYIKG